jgi:hypothetical protein
MQATVEKTQRTSSARRSVTHRVVHVVTVEVHDAFWELPRDEIESQRRRNGRYFFLRRS